MGRSRSRSPPRRGEGTQGHRGEPGRDGNAGGGQGAPGEIQVEGPRGRGGLKPSRAGDVGEAPVPCCGGEQRLLPSSSSSSSSSFFFSFFSSLCFLLLFLLFFFLLFSFSSFSPSLPSPPLLFCSSPHLSLPSSGFWGPSPLLPDFPRVISP